jgi:tetratricopeptide (TPR) repeat protein
MPFEQTIDNRSGLTDSITANEDLAPLYRAALRRFCRISTSFVLFNVMFLALFSGEIVLFIVLMPFLAKSVFLAISFSGLFLTIFSYFILQFYFSAKKPEQFTQLKDQFIASCQQKMSNGESGAVSRLSCAIALLQLSVYLEEFEWRFYRIPQWMRSAERLLSALSAHFHWRDVLRFRHILITAAIEEHLQQVRAAPTDIELHVSLASSWLALSKIFSEPSRPPNPSAYQKRKEAFDRQFQFAARQAIEEFRILDHLSPNDPWIHEQLAHGYRDLDMPREELQELETLLKLRPHHPGILLRFGTVCFEQGFNARALQIYEQLKQLSHTHADELLASYKLDKSVVDECF